MISDKHSPAVSKRRYANKYPVEAMESVLNTTSMPLPSPVPDLLPETAANPQVLRVTHPLVATLIDDVIRKSWLQELTQCSQKSALSEVMKGQAAYLKQCGPESSVINHHKAKKDKRDKNSGSSKPRSTDQQADKAQEKNKKNQIKIDPTIMYLLCCHVCCHVL